MSASGHLDPDRIAQLRRAFDESFATPPPVETGEPEALLLILAAAEVFALPVVQLGGLMAAHRVVPVPSRQSELLGMAGAGGAPVAVFDLGALLGRRSSSAKVNWLALAGRDTAVALAFEGIAGQVEAAPASIYDGAVSTDCGALRRMVRTGSRVFPIVDVTSIVERIRSIAGSLEPDKE